MTLRRPNLNLFGFPVKETITPNAADGLEFVDLASYAAHLLAQYSVYPPFPDEPQPTFTIHPDGSHTVDQFPKQLAIELQCLSFPMFHVARDGITIKAANAEAEYQVLGWNPIHKCLICGRLDG